MLLSDEVTAKQLSKTFLAVFFKNSRLDYVFKSVGLRLKMCLRFALAVVIRVYRFQFYYISLYTRHLYG